MKISIAFILTLLFSMSSYSEIPTNDEFSWSSSGPGESDFLKPKGWFLKKESKAGTYAIFITKENIDKEGVFQTGLTVNVLKGISKKTGNPASLYAHKFITIAAQKEKNKILVKPWLVESGPFKGYGIRVQDEVKILHYMLIANDKEDTLFLTIFEAKPKDWDKAWKYGEVILNNMKLDDEV